MPGFRIGLLALVEYAGFWVARLLGVWLFFALLLLIYAIGPSENPGLEWCVLIAFVVSVVVFFKTWSWTVRVLGPRLQARFDRYEYDQRAREWAQYEEWRRMHGGR